MYVSSLFLFWEHANNAGDWKKGDRNGIRECVIGQGDQKEISANCSKKKKACKRKHFLFFVFRIHILRTKVMQWTNLEQQHIHPPCRDLEQRKT
jgi:hypothetical protein